MILDAILHGIAVIVWYIGALLCQLLDLIYQMFEVFVGMDTVTYTSTNGETSQSYLINVFFANSTITKVYWGMAAIGIAMTFGFAIWAVVKKMFDSNDKMKSTYSSIGTSVFKAILIICLMSGIVSATINASNILMQQITYVFDNADTLGMSDEIVFDDDEYATMFRVLNTIGNYSLNPSKDSRYNVNSCFNDIRQDLQRLDSKGVLDFDYKYAEITTTTKDSYGKETSKTEIKEIQSWQSAIAKIAASHSIYADLNLDEYYPVVQKAMLECMEGMQKNADFAPLPSRYYKRINETTTTEAYPGRICMLAASMGCAYEEIGTSGFLGIGGKKGKGVAPDAGIMDHIRYPFYSGADDVYDLGEVEDVFNIDFGHWNHIVAIVGAYFLIKEFAACMLNAVARIFNMMLLYLIAPLVISVYPLDEGGKFKQWSTAFIVQSFSVFGTVIAIRLLMLFVPLVMSNNLVIFETPFSNIVAKIVLIIGAGLTCEKAAGLITGILADNAGMAALSAGDIGNVARGAVSAGASLVGSVAAGAAGKAADVTGLTTLGNAIGSGVNQAGSAMKEHGGLVGAIGHSIAHRGDGKDAGAKANKDMAKNSAGAHSAFSKDNKTGETKTVKEPPKIPRK